MLADDLHFAFQKAVAVLVVAVLLQFDPQGRALPHPPVEALQGRGGLAPWAVKGGQLYLGVRADDERLFVKILIFFFHITGYLMIIYT